MINKIKEFTKYEKTIFILLPLLLLSLYLASIDVKYSVAADATGKWLQARDVITKPLFDFSCSYNYDFDKEFKYIPGAAYFYFIENGKCSHMYPYGFAYLYAPFLYLFSDYGIFILNYFSWLIFIFSFANLTKIAVKENENAYFYGGLFAILITPTIIYAIGFTEVTLTYALACYCLYIIFGSLIDDENNVKIGKLFFSGIILGLIFALRTESIIYAGCVGLSAFVYSLIKRKSFRFYLSFFTPLGVGLILSLGLVAYSHLVLFGNILGFRGMAAASLIKGGFSIANQLEIAKIQLFYGNRGLFTSMPIILFSFGYCFSSIREKVKEEGLFFFLIAFLNTFLVVATTPWGDFADWTPRYIALAFAPFFILVLQITLSFDSDFLKNKWMKRIFVVLLLYSLVFNLTGVVLTSIITRMVKNINVKIEEIKTDSIVLDTLIPYIYISQYNIDKPIFNLKLGEADTEEIGKQRLIDLVNLLDEKRKDRSILIIQVEGISKFIFTGNEINGWKPTDSMTIMKKIKFLKLEKKQ